MNEVFSGRVQRHEVSVIITLEGRSVDETVPVNNNIDWCSDDAGDLYDSSKRTSFIASFVDTLGNFCHGNSGDFFLNLGASQVQQVFQVDSHAAATSRSLCAILKQL